MEDTLQSKDVLTSTLQVEQVVAHILGAALAREVESGASSVKASRPRRVPTRVGSKCVAGIHDEVGR